MQETMEHREQNNSGLIYAPNGVIKTPLSKTMNRLSRGEHLKDDVVGKQSSFSVAYTHLVDDTKLWTTGSLENVFVIHSLYNINDSQNPPLRSYYLLMREK